MPVDDPKDPLAAYEDKPIDDRENPEWTEADFARAKSMPKEILDTFPKMRGRPRKPPGEKKRQISIKLHPMVLDHYKAGGPGWQTRMEKVLIDAAFNEAGEEHVDARAPRPVLKQAVADSLTRSSTGVVRGYAGASTKKIGTAAFSKRATKKAAAAKKGSRPTARKGSPAGRSGA